MKKTFTVLLIIVAVAAFLTGCSKKSGSDGAVVSKGGTQYLNMATGGTGGTYYALGADLANMISKAVENTEVTASVGNGSASNIRELNSGDADLAFSQNDVATYAYTGTETFKGEKITSFGVIGNLYPEVVQAAFCDNTGISSIKDFKGRRISVGAAGSGVYQSVVDFLDASGMSLDDIQAQYLSFTESADAIKNGQIDAAFVTAAIPNPAIQDLAATRNIEMLNLSDEAVKKLCASKPYVEYTIKAGTYKGQDSDAKTVAVTALLLASDKLDEATVYNITKAIYESTDMLSHDKKSDISIKTALDGFDKSMLHPGAAKYYREKGLIK